MDDAVLLRHGHIIIDRTQLPEIDDGVYYSDLENKSVVDIVGVDMGKVVHVHDFGAGPVLELAPSGMMVSFYSIIDADADILQIHSAKDALWWSGSIIKFCVSINFKCYIIFYEKNNVVNTREK